MKMTAGFGEKVTEKTDFRLAAGFRHNFLESVKSLESLLKALLYEEDTLHSVYFLRAGLHSRNFEKRD